MAKLPLFEKVRFSNINFQNSKKDNTVKFFFLFSLIIFLIFAILLVRLFELTIVKGSYYRRLSEENRIKELIIEPLRGKILDRKGLVIASNNAVNLESNNDRLVSNRVYKDGEVIAPLVGFRQLADRKDLKSDSCINKLKLGDKAGKEGVEKIFECQLRGKSGKKLVEVDARHKYLKTLSIIPPVDGQTLQLALDFELQKTAYSLIKDKKAAVVGLKPKTGEILLLLSTPSFDPQAFEDKSTNEINKYLTDKANPLFNRATSGTYPPGSIYKPLVATAALEEKKIDEQTIFEDTGTIKAGPLTFGNWYFLEYGKTEGKVNIVQALKRSNDIFFYKTSELLGAELMKKWALKFGLGGITNLGLNEEEGLIPSSFWKEEVLHERWYLGDTYNTSIGQGYVLVTPLQMARAAAVFANGGYLCKPELIKVETSRRDVSTCQKLSISQKNYDLIKQGMLQACQKGGTGWPFFDFKPEVACKTGTAESHAKDKLPHAWFTVYAPADNPEIVLVVLVEESGQGSNIAAPIAKEILKAYFERSS